MQKINFQNLPSTLTPINATNLNAIQTNVEDVFNGNDVAGNMVVSGIRTKNMFNKGNFVSGLNINSSGTYISENASGAGISYVKVEAGKTYTISSNTNRAWYYNFSTSIPTLNGTGTSRIGESGTARTFTVPSGYTYFCLRSYPSNNEDNINQNIQLEKGSVATAYTPYQDLNPIISEDLTQNDLISLNSGFTINHFNVVKIGKQILGTIVVSSTNEISTSNVIPFTFKNYAPKISQYTFCGLGTADYRVNAIGYSYFGPSGVVLVNQSGISGMKTAILNINYTTS